jgi:hypothetical protein
VWIFSGNPGRERGDGMQKTLSPEDPLDRMLQIIETMKIDLKSIRDNQKLHVRDIRICKEELSGALALLNNSISPSLFERS